MSPAERRAVLFLALGLWNEAAWSTRQWLLRPLVPGTAQPLQRYRPGRHHVDIDVKPQPLPVPDPMDDVLTDRLHRMADKMAPHYNLRG